MTKADRGLRDAVTGKGRQKNPRIKTQQIQEQLAEKANMDVSMLARIERGSRGDIRMSTLERIVSGLDVSYQEFFTFPEDGDETTELASSIALIKDPEVIRALHKIVNTLIHRDNK